MYKKSTVSKPVRHTRERFHVHSRAKEMEWLDMTYIVDVSILGLGNANDSRTASFYATQAPFKSQHVMRPRSLTPSITILVMILM